MSVIVEMMEKSEFRAVIKHFYLKKWTAAQIKTELDEVHGDSTLSLKTIYFWINEFKRGRKSTEDEPRSGRPPEMSLETINHNSLCPSEIVKVEIKDDNYEESDYINTQSDDNESENRASETDNENMCTELESGEVDIGEKPQDIDKNSISVNKRRHSRKVFNTFEGESPYECDKCDRKFKSFGSLKMHAVSHTDIRSFACDICGKLFKSSHNLSAHQRTHLADEDRPYKCQFCKRGFWMNCELIKHLRTHTGQRPFICDICNRGFLDSSKLSRHKRVCSGKLPYKCDQCDKAYPMPGELRRHKASHVPVNERQFPCDECNKRFIDEHQLTLHKRTHSETILCTVCDKKFQTKRNLRKHIASHTKTSKVY